MIRPLSVRFTLKREPSLTLGNVDGAFACSIAHWLVYSSIAFCIPLATEICMRAARIWGAFLTNTSIASAAVLMFSPSESKPSTFICRKRVISMSLLQARYFILSVSYLPISSPADFPVSSCASICLPRAVLRSLLPSSSLPSSVVASSVSPRNMANKPISVVMAVMTSPIGLAFSTTLSALVARVAPLVAVVSPTTAVAWSRASLAARRFCRFATPMTRVEFLLRVFATCCTPLARAMAPCTFFIVSSNSLFSSPKSASAPWARDTAPATPSNRPTAVEMPLMSSAK